MLILFNVIELFRRTLVLNDDELFSYLNKIETETLFAYGVYQIEADGLELFEYVKGDKDSIMGLPVKEILNYLKQLKKWKKTLE